MDKLKSDKKSNNEELYNITISTIDQHLSRVLAIEDPVLRHTLFIDKLYIFLDLMTVIIQTLASEYDDKLKNKADILIGKVNDELTQLMSWIRQPIYSPEHPYGNKLMMDAKKDFEKQ